MPKETITVKHYYKGLRTFMWKISITRFLHSFFRLSRYNI